MSYVKIISFISALLLIVSCASGGPPKTFVEANNESGWKTIHLHGNYGLFRNKNQEVWQRVVDILSKKKYRFEERDNVSGYIRTSWKNRLFTDDSEKQYRSRVIIKMVGRRWHTAQLKVETQWRDNTGDSWVTGYDSSILEEIEKDLQGRVGTSVR
ncbi:MAG: hypothetical protein DRR08_04390 [Candidatus Parabeggiatoa sp. nov. 2]|nr:MAG: hypothetical protein B6247_07650 [Beggiatoa sp. 4572_84]RKZ63079.1 MAG: hypothetical protein DRR08_04390 [Gammaproteobacteria bacterium]